MSSARAERSPEFLPRALSNAMARICSEFYGKGPVRARTYIFDSYVFAMLDDVLTTAETTLKQGGKQSLVRQLRLAFEDLMTATFVGEVERLTRTRVIGYHSQVVFNPDMAIEIFVLDRVPEGENLEPAADVESARLQEPGSVGDADALPGTAIAAGDAPAKRSLPRAGHGDGRVRAGVANAMVRLTRTYWGRGPTRGKAFFEDDFVFCVLEEPLTTVERTLVQGGQTLLVRHARIELQEIVNPEYAKEVERILGRRVLAGHSQIVFDPDILFLVFVLDSAEVPDSDGLSSRDADIEAPVLEPPASAEVSDST
jgi:uncharacterized protein YbcI